MKIHLFLLLLLVPIIAIAEELVMKPGLWEITTTRTSTMGGGKVIQTEKQCLKHQKFDPQSIMQDMQSCELLSNELKNENTLLFNMTCSMTGAKASLSGNYYTKNDKGMGEMKVQVDMGGMVMEMDISWDAKRLGDCQ
jgi:hypothetical protein